jgi:hypothetical protein
MRQYHTADPQSKRSQKRALRLALQQNEPEAILCAASEFKQRQNNRDNRFSNHITNDEAEKLLGQQSPKKLRTVEKKEPDLKVFQAEVNRLYQNWVDTQPLNEQVTLHPQMFFNAAHFNLTSYVGESTRPSSPNDYVLRYIEKAKKIKQPIVQSNNGIVKIIKR